ncbi:MAG: Rho termination protein [Leptolyngbya sp.]|nr:MAG: Rho termination protein [Leptolyngbya sp.]
MSTERLPIDEMTLRQLRRVASECGVSRYSRMRKDQLLAAIQAIQAMQQQGEIAAQRERAPQEVVETAKFNLGQDDRTGGTLASVDEGLPDLPQGYGDSRIVLMPRDPQWAYTYWDISFGAKQQLRQQGGQQLALRIYDVTDVSFMFQAPHSIQEYPCDELAQEWYLPIPVSDRDYVIDIGYRCADGRWLVLARSAPVRIPPIYPSDWIEDQFLTVPWEEELRGKTYAALTSPGKQMTVDPSVSAYEPVYGLTEINQADHVAGSIHSSTQQTQVPGSIQHVAGSVQHVAGSIQQSVSSYVLASGSGMWAVPGAVTMSGSGMSGVGISSMTTSGVGMSNMTTSGVGMSGVGMSGVGMSGVGMSGVGFSGSLPIIRPRQFWLIADAELIVYGTTEPDATVTVGGRPIALNPDGTFRFQMSFQDGLIDYPIMAVAADGEQMRAIHMKFNRETPERRTNTKEEAVDEWIS